GAVPRINLDGGCVCPLRHESLSSRWNGVVLRRDHVPRRDRLPRGVTRRRHKSLVRERSLSRLHLIGHLERQVAGECVVERRLLQVQVGPRTAVRQRIRTEIQRGGTNLATRFMVTSWTRDSPLSGANAAM